MLAKLAIKNIRYYAGNYIVYLITVCFLSWAYYTFISLSNGSYMQILQMNKVYRSCFGIGAWTLLIFTAIFIWFSTDFFFQQRKQEFGMYIMLGIKKNKVSALLCIETVILGMISTTVGIIAGVVTASPVQKLLALILNENADGTISAMLPASELAFMFLKFFCVFALFSALNCVSIRRSELIDLFHAKYLQEQPLKTSMPRTAPGIVLLLAGYVMIFQVKDGSNVHLLPIGLGCVTLGTVILFMLGTGHFAGIIRKSRHCASNISSRVNITAMLHCVRRNTGAWATIALLIGTSVSTFILAYGMYQPMKTAADELGSDGAEILNMTKVLIIVLLLVGIALLASTGSILYFRALSEMQDNRKNYRVLFCIGAGKQDLKQTIRKQSLTMFLLPFGAGILHSLVFSLYIQQRNLLHSFIPVIASIAVYAVIYMLYYIISIKQGYRLAGEACRQTA